MSREEIKATLTTLVNGQSSVQAVAAQLGFESGDKLVDELAALLAGHATRRAWNAAFPQPAPPGGQPLNLVARQIRSGSVAFFLGAGVHMAGNAANRLPSGSELAERLGATLLAPPPPELGLARVAQSLEP